MPPLRSFLPAIIAVLVLHQCVFADMKTESLFSTTLNKTVSYNFYYLSDYAAKAAQGKKYPVVYLLHWWSGNSDNWHVQGWQSNPECDKAIHEVEMIAVAPNDDTKISWWMDSPVDSDMQYATFLRTDLKKHIDSTYSVLTDKKNTGLCGPSMGGYGALRNVMDFPEVFGAAYGIVSGVNLPAYEGEYNLPDILGPYQQNKSNWEKADILGNVGKFAGKDIHIGLSINEDDMFFEDNNLLHDALDSLQIEHTYIIHPSGGHSYPDKAQMIEILKWLASIFDGGQSSGKAKPLRMNFIRPAETHKAHVCLSAPCFSVLVGENRNAFQHVYQINGRVTRHLLKTGNR
jgi:S-formylglutathione hydrolase FrmB